jgi:hypothetical protein
VETHLDLDQLLEVAVEEEALTQVNQALISKVVTVVAAVDKLDLLLAEVVVQETQDRQQLLEHLLMVGLVVQREVVHLIQDTLAAVAAALLKLDKVVVVEVVLKDTVVTEENFQTLLMLVILLVLDLLGLDGHQNRIPTTLVVAVV